MNTFFEKHLVDKNILQFFTCTSAKLVMAIPQKNIKKNIGKSELKSVILWKHHVNLREFIEGVSHTYSLFHSRK